MSRSPAFPLTTLIIDALIARLPTSEMQANWKAGKYRGVSGEHAKGYMEARW